LKVAGAPHRANRYLHAPTAAAGGWVATLGSAGAVAIAYFLAARLGLALLSKPSDVAVFWPASGIAVGILVLCGRRALPALVIGVVVGTVAANLMSDRSLLTSLFKGLCNASEAVLVAWLLERWFGRPFTFGDLHRVAGFLAAAGLATAASAIGGAAIMTLFHTSAPYWEVWRAWFLSDGVGIVVVAPLMIGLGQMQRELPTRGELIEGFGVLGLLASASLYVVTHPAGSWVTFSPGAVVVPLLLWLTVRCPSTFAIAGAFLASIAVILATTFGVGRFGDAAVPMMERVKGAQAAATTVTLYTLALVALFAQHKAAEQGLRKSERRFAERNLQLALAGKVALVGSFAYDTDTEIMQISEGYAAIHGFPEGTAEIARSKCLAAVHPDDLGRVGQFRSEAFREGQPEYNVEYRIIRPGGEVRWVETRCFIAYNGERRPHRVIGVSIDITERKRVEEQQRFLFRELDHRVKNALATVSSVVSHTREGSRSVANFAATLEGRIRSMAATHELLSSRQWQGISLIELVRRELAPYATRNNTEIDGPEVVLRPEAGQAMAMVLHELVTNAAKYGALSTRNGCVSIRWKRPPNGHPRSRLVLEWQEIGGPPVVAPAEPSYGTSTIRDLIPYEFGGTVDLVLAPEGVRCRLEVPADCLSNDGEPVSEAMSHAFSLTEHA